MEEEEERLLELAEEAALAERAAAEEDEAEFHAQQEAQTWFNEQQEAQRIQWMSEVGINLVTTHRQSWEVDGTGSVDWITPGEGQDSTFTRVTEEDIQAVIDDMSTEPQPTIVQFWGNTAQATLYSAFTDASVTYYYGSGDGINNDEIEEAEDYDKWK